MRRSGGLALIALGVLSVLVGVTFAVAFGPDDRLSTGPHRLSSPGPVIVTAPQALAYAGPRVELRVTAERPGTPLFLGVAHDVDVRDFLGDTPRTMIETIAIPWDVTTRQVRGDGSPKGSPQQPGWWIAQARGEGETAMMWTLPDSAADVVILDEDGQGGLTVEVTAALLAPGAFVAGLAGVVLGLGIGVFGWAVLTTRVAPRGVHALRRGRRVRTSATGDSTTSESAGEQR